MKLAARVSVMLTLLSVHCFGQLPQIRITGVFPPGGRQGTSTDVTVTAGVDMDEAAELVFSHPGLKAVPRPDSAGNPIPGQFTVTVAADVPPGLYDLRLRGLFGISNPRIFRVDALPERNETEPNNSPQTATPVDINSVVNARSNANTDVDYFQLALKSHQTIVVRTEAAVIDSPMQAIVEVFDADGRRIAVSRRQRHRDAVLALTSTADQTCVIKVRDVVFAGGNDYGYRLIVDTRPLVDAVIPQVVQRNADTPVTVQGRNLPQGQPTGQTINGVEVTSRSQTVRLDDDPNRNIGAEASAASIDTAVYSGIEGNLITFGLTDQQLPVVRDNAANDRPVQVTLPTVLAGSFEKEQDEDVFRFQAAKGQKWAIEVFGQRLGANTDPQLVVEKITTSADGSETASRIAKEDDGRLNPGGNILPTLTSDPSFLFVVPEDATYQLRLTDRFAASRGSADLVWNAVITEAVPDFRLVVFESLPSLDGKAPPGTGAVSIRKGGSYAVPVYVYRRNGHNADIHLKLERLPQGVTCAPAVIAAGRTDTTLVFSAAADASESFGFIRIVATSTVNDRPVNRIARTVTLVHDSVNGLPRTARVSASMPVCVMRDEEPFTVVPELTRVEVSQDQQVLIPLKVIRRAGFENKVDVVITGQPANTDIPKISFAKDQDTALARFYFKENAPTGPATIRMYATGQVPYRRNPWQVDRAKQQLADAVARLEKSRNSVAAAKAAADAAAAKVAALEQMLKKWTEELTALKQQSQKARTELQAAIGRKNELAAQLSALQDQLKALTAADITDPTELDGTIKAIESANTAVVAATKPVAQLTEQLRQLTRTIAEKEKQIADKNARIKAARAEMPRLKQAIEKAMADMQAATAAVKSAEAEHAAAQEAVKKAEAAAKPQNKNYRSVSVPVDVFVNPAPGKLAVTVPNSGAIRKGTSIDVKVAVTRKNNFKGPVSVRLVLPNEQKTLTSSVAQIPPDASEATLKITAAPDAAAGDVANAVVRATVDFNGRTASFDAPISLKVTE